MADWYVGQGGQQRGPFSEDVLRGMLGRGEISPSDLVWREGMAQWTPVSQVAELQPPAPAPAPPAYAPPAAPAPAPAPPAPAPAAPAPAPAAPAYAAPPAPAPAPVADTSAWYIGRGGQQLGPYGTAAVQGMVSSGQLAPGDLLWKQGMAQWLPPASIPEFAPYMRPGAPGVPFAPMAPTGPSPVGLFFSNFVKDTMGVVANPDKGLEEAADRKSITFALVWICLKVLLGGLMVFQLASSRAPSSVGEAMQALAALGNMAGGAGDSTFVVFLKTMLFDVVQIAIVFGALMLVMAGIFRTPDSFPKAMAVIGLSYIPAVAIAAVVFILGWLSGWFRCLSAAIEPARIILFYLIFQHTTQQPRRVAVLCVVAILFGCSIIGGVIPRF